MIGIGFLEKTMEEAVMSDDIDCLKNDCDCVNHDGFLYRAIGLRLEKEITSLNSRLTVAEKHETDALDAVADRLEASQSTISKLESNLDAAKRTSEHWKHMLNRMKKEDRRTITKLRGALYRCEKLYCGKAAERAKLSLEQHDSDCFIHEALSNTPDGEDGGA